jgi:hypothetical protein
VHEPGVLSGRQLAQTDVLASSLGGPDHPNQYGAMNSEDRRKYPRKKVDRPLSVDDLGRGEPLGCLVDISIEGLMLISPDPIEVNRVFQLSLELPPAFGAGEVVLFGAESMWREPSSDPGKYWVGFQIIDIAPEHVGKIHRLIDECL